MNAQKSEAGDKGPSFEKSLARLEEIVAQMEKGSLDLEEMIQRFEEGRKLIAQCGKKLNEVERKVEVLVKKDGEMKAEPFDEETTQSPHPPQTTENGELF